MSSSKFCCQACRCMQTHQLILNNIHNIIFAPFTGSGDFACLQVPFLSLLNSVSIECLVQIANVTNAALDKLRAAGVVMVPFDSTGLINISATAWGGQLPKSSAYETSDTTSR